MAFIRKLGLVFALTIACALWLPLLALRGILAVLNWIGRGLLAAVKHKDSGVKILGCIVLGVYSPLWGVAVLLIMILAFYEIFCFALMQRIFEAEDIGYKPNPQPPSPRSGEVALKSARVIQMPSSNQILTTPQALAASKSCGWNPIDLGYSWSSQHQCWFNDQEAVRINGDREGFVKDGKICA